MQALTDDVHATRNHPPQARDKVARAESGTQIPAHVSRVVYIEADSTGLLRVIFVVLMYIQEIVRYCYHVHSSQTHHTMTYKMLLSYDNHCAL